MLPLPLLVLLRLLLRGDNCCQLLELELVSAAVTAGTAPLVALTAAVDDAEEIPLG